MNAFPSAALAVAALALGPISLQAGIIITPSAGFLVSWNGNDGEHFDPTPPPTGAVVPDNAALASNGGVAFASSLLGGGSFAPTHTVPNLNDGSYGNSNSWIGDDGDVAPHAGVLLPALTPIVSIAFGRDNGNGAFDDSFLGTDACGGQCDDRWGGGGFGLGGAPGSYTLEVTSNAGATWDVIALLTYEAAGGDIAPGGAFTPWMRHEFGVSDASGDPIMADGVRILVPLSGIAGGTAIDEIEVFAAPEASESVLFALGLTGLLSFRRKRSARSPS